MPKERNREKGLALAYRDLLAPWLARRGTERR